jgi:phage-related protein
MSRTINASLERQKNLLESQGLLSLFEVQVSASPVTYAYYTNHNATIGYFKPGTVTPQVYEVAPIYYGEISTDSGTSVPSVSLNVGVVDRVMSAYLEANDGLRRNQVKTITVPRDMLNNASACLVDTFYVDSCTIDHSKKIAVFDLTTKGQIANVTVPLRRMRRDNCPWKYNTASQCLASRIGTCGDRASMTDSTCRKTKDACASKGNVINFGGFPGVGTKKVFF